MLEKIISGGQTGADQGGLEAAMLLGLQTGGIMPRGFKTEAGPRPSFAAKFNLLADFSPAYQPRTRLNILAADATLIFGNTKSPGSALTINLCLDLSRPFRIIPFPCAKIYLTQKSYLLSWLEELDITILNVAGNRESTNPGIQIFVRDFLFNALKGVL
jgi:hypothetical protein